MSMAPPLPNSPCRQRLPIGQPASSNYATVTSLNSVPRLNRSSEVFPSNRTESRRFSFDPSHFSSYQAYRFKKRTRLASLIPTWEEGSHNRRLSPTRTRISKATFEDARTHLYGDRPYGHTDLNSKSRTLTNYEGGGRGGKHESLSNERSNPDITSVKSLKGIVKRLSSTITKSWPPRCSLSPESKVDGGQTKYPGPVRHDDRALIFGDENPQKIEEYSSDFYKTYFPVLKIDWWSRSVVKKYVNLISATIQPLA